jgi:TRAP-type C4-dicarboxylate transport system permease small subunit
MNPIRVLCRLHDAVTDVGYVVSVIGLSAMVLIYCAEVITRYFLNTALDWANDTFSNVMCVTIFAMVPHATRAGRHIAINLIPEQIPSTRRPLHVFTAVAGFVVCLFAAWMSWEENARQVALGILTAQNHPVPVVWMSAFITYGFGSSALYFLRSLFPGPDVVPVCRVASMPTTLASSAG